MAVSVVAGADRRPVRPGLEGLGGTGRPIGYIGASRLRCSHRALGRLDLNRRGVRGEWGGVTVATPPHIAKYYTEGTLGFLHASLRGPFGTRYLSASFRITFDPKK